MSEEHLEALVEVIQSVWEATIADEGYHAIRAIAHNIATEFAYFDGDFDADEFLRLCGC